MDEKKRTVEYSHTEWMKCIQYEDINGSGRILIPTKIFHYEKGKNAF